MFCVIMRRTQVVGSQARILYSNEEGRLEIALAFNKAIADGKIMVWLSVVSCGTHTLLGSFCVYHVTLVTMKSAGVLC